MISRLPAEKMDVLEEEFFEVWEQDVGEVGVEEGRLIWNERGEADDVEDGRIEEGEENIPSLELFLLLRVKVLEVLEVLLDRNWTESEEVDGDGGGGLDQSISREREGSSDVRGCENGEGSDVGECE